MKISNPTTLSLTNNQLLVPGVAVCYNRPFVRGANECYYTVMFSKLTFKQKQFVGHRYEGYIAWKLRAEGWNVEPRTKYGYFDRGIDLIATKEGKVRYIQCKGWSWHRTVYENVIDQLYGAVAYQAGPEHMAEVEIYVYSSTRPSPYASDHAKRLNIQIFHAPFPNWRRKAIEKYKLRRTG